MYETSKKKKNYHETNIPPLIYNKTHMRHWCLILSKIKCIETHNSFYIPNKLHHEYVSRASMSYTTMTMLIHHDLHQTLPPPPSLPPTPSVSLSSLSPFSYLSPNITLQVTTYALLFIVTGKNNFHPHPQHRYCRHLHLLEWSISPTQHRQTHNRINIISS